MKKLLIVLVLLCTACNSSAYKKINQETAQKLIENGATLIDVREPVEYNEKHIENAINIASGDLEQMVSKLFMKDEALIVYCKSGTRSKAAAQTLISMGYTKVYDLGSIENWK